MSAIKRKFDAFNEGLDNTLIKVRLGTVVRNRNNILHLLLFDFVKLFKEIKEQ
jgi:hypothetical protein